MLFLVLAGLVMTSPSGPPSPPAAVEGTARSKDGVAIHYVARGRGEPALVFVHGWVIDGGYWDAQMAAFARERRVVALDLAGHGRSGRNRTSWSMAAFGEDVRAVVEALGIRKAILVGHSMSGNVVLEAALGMPDRTAGLVPVDTLLDVEARIPEEQIAPMIARFRADFAGTLEAFADQYLFVPTMAPALRTAVLADMTSVPVEIAVPVLEASWRYDPRPALSRLRMPIHAINADKFPTKLDDLRRYAPQYQATYVHGVGHYPMREDAPAFEARLRAAVSAIEHETARSR